jgi:hypothetical protein
MLNDDHCAKLVKRLDERKAAIGRLALDLKWRRCWRKLPLRSQKIKHSYPASVIRYLPD